VLFGGLEGDPGFGDTNGDGVIDNAKPAGNPNSLANEVISTIISLDPTKTCNYCTLQWAWAARSDGGYYLGCADISITADGLQPDFNLLPPEAGNALPSGGTGNSGGNGNGSGGGGGGVWVAFVVIFLLIGAGGAGYYAYQNYFKGDSGGSGRPTSTPPPPGSSGARPGALPAGWKAEVDPSSGQTYYVNAMGQSSWDPPQSTPAPPSGVPPMPQAKDLPPGWSEVKDDSSGRFYYINNATGASTWEKPSNRM